MSDSAPLSSISRIVLCSGQGAQFVGMGRAWAEKSGGRCLFTMPAPGQLDESVRRLVESAPVEPVDIDDA